MSGRSGSSFASSMAGAGAHSGRGGRERQGEAQQRHQDQNDLALSDSSASVTSEQENLAPAPPASRRPAASYSLWTDPKKTCVLQAFVDTPRQMLQVPSDNQDLNFDRTHNRSGEMKDSLDKLECVSVMQLL
jgi:hypothetical protein